VSLCKFSVAVDFEELKRIVKECKQFGVNWDLVAERVGCTSMKEQIKSYFYYKTRSNPTEKSRKKRKFTILNEIYDFDFQKTNLSYFDSDFLFVSDFFVKHYIK
jgi:hypothetical protein